MHLGYRRFHGHLIVRLCIAIELIIPHSPAGSVPYYSYFSSSLIASFVVPAILQKVAVRVRTNGSGFELGR